jgi:hypothetical protein
MTFLRGADCGPGRPSGAESGPSGMGSAHQATGPVSDMEPQVGRSVGPSGPSVGHNGGGPSVTVLTSWWPLKSVAVDLGHAAFTLMPE